MSLLWSLPAHLGGLHPFEAVLVGLLAFGPFVVLGIVVAVVRRRDLAAEQAQPEGTPVGPGDTPGAGPAAGSAAGPAEERRG